MAANRRRSKPKPAGDDPQIGFDLEPPRSPERADSPSVTEAPTGGGLSGPPTGNIHQEPSPAINTPSPQPETSLEDRRAVHMHGGNLSPQIAGNAYGQHEPRRATTHALSEAVEWVARLGERRTEAAGGTGDHPAAPEGETGGRPTGPKGRGRTRPRSGPTGTRPTARATGSQTVPKAQGGRG
jgi:hypothetical protein